MLLNKITKISNHLPLQLCFKTNLDFAQLKYNCANSLTRTITYSVHHDGFVKPYQFNMSFPNRSQKQYYRKQDRIIPKIDRVYSDIIQMPGYDQNSIITLLHEVRIKKVPLSPTNICMLINMFTKYKVIGTQTFNMLQKQALKYKGQYQIRSIFGALRGAIHYNRMELARFFIQQYSASQKRFTLRQLSQLLQAVNKNNDMKIQEKVQFWHKNFQEEFKQGFLSNSVKKLQVSQIVSLYDNLDKVKALDQKASLKMINLMKGKKGWDRIPMLQRLYQMSGTYEQAKKCFDWYFDKLAQQQSVVARYNLTQLRYKSPLEIIKHCEQNPSDYQPKIRTLIDEQNFDAAEWNQKYEKFKTTGSVKQQQQIIRDKSKSLGFAIRERYNSMMADGSKYEKMSPQEFEQMFGNFEQATKTIKQQDQKNEGKEFSDQNSQNTEEAQNKTLQKKKKSRKIQMQNLRKSYKIMGLGNGSKGKIAIHEYTIQQSRMIGLQMKKEEKQKSLQMCTQVKQKKQKKPKKQKKQKKTQKKQNQQQNQQQVVEAEASNE